jgi:hypothetical protein
MLAKKILLLLKINFYLIPFVFCFKCPIVFATECSHYLIENKKILSLNPIDVPLDSLFYNPDGSAIVLKKPFVWAIKDQNQKLIGLLVGTSHDYISIDMFPESFRALLVNVNYVFTEHSSQQNGELNSILIRQNFEPSIPSLYSQLTQAERNRVMDDFLEYQFMKSKISIHLNSDLYSPQNSFNLVNLSAFGFIDRLTENSEVATSALNRQLVQLDDQIARFAKFNGATWGFLEEGPEHLINFANGFTFDQVKTLLTTRENIFEQSYFSVRQLLTQYKNGDLSGLKKYVDGLTDSERQSFLTDRNKLWIPKIVSQFRKNEVTLVIAGAYHFVGKDNVIELLESEGYSVERLTFE